VGNACRQLFGTEENYEAYDMVSGGGRVDWHEVGCAR
jgi:hypothetical protein